MPSLSSIADEFFASVWWQEVHPSLCLMPDRSPEIPPEECNDEPQPNDRYRSIVDRQRRLLFLYLILSLVNKSLLLVFSYS